VPTTAEPFTNFLNVMLSGEKGGQFFWVIPCWIAGLIVAYFGTAVAGITTTAGDG
jgi:hypothetical protein